jgi:hypothetical protein
LIEMCPCCASLHRQPRNADDHVAGALAGRLNGADAGQLKTGACGGCQAGSNPPAGEASRGDARALRLLLQLTERYGESAQTGAEYEMTGAEDLAILRRYLPDFDDPSPTGP